MTAKKTILCIDDHPLVAVAVRQMTQHLEQIASVTSVIGPACALAEIERLKPDIVVLEMAYANGAGLSLIKDVHIQHPNVAMVVFSSLEGAAYVEHCIRCGARAFVSKSEPIEELGRALEQVLLGNLYLGANRVGALLSRMVEGGRNAASETSVQRLSDGEFEVFCLIGQGKANRDIAELLHRSIKTIETYRSRIKDKLGIRTGAELIQYAFRFLSSDQESRPRNDRSAPVDPASAILADLVSQPTIAS